MQRWTVRAPAGGRHSRTAGPGLVLQGCIGSTLCSLGGLLTAALPGATWVAGLPPVDALRDSPAGRVLGFLMVVGGVTIAALAWLALLAHVGHRSSTEDVATRLSLVRWTAAAWSLPLLGAPPLFSRDGWSYAAQGQLAHLGFSPYLVSPSALHGPIVQAVDPLWLHTVSPYGPLPLLWGSWAAAVTNDPWFLVLAHRLFAVAGLVLLGYAVPRLATWSGQDPALATALVLASPLMLADGIGGLHNDLMLAGLVAVALVVAEERGWVLGAVLAGLAAAVKVPGGLVGVGVALLSLPSVVAWQVRLRRLLAVTLVAVATLVGTGAAAGIGTGWVPAVLVPVQVRTPLSLSTELGALGELVSTALGAHTLAAASVPTMRVLGSLAALALVAWVALRAPTGSPRSALRTTAVVMLGTLVLSPVVQHWYALWVQPLLAACRLRRRWFRVLVWGCVALGLVASLDGALTGSYLGSGVVVAEVLAAIAALVVAERRASGRVTFPGPVPAPAPGIRRPG